MDCRSMLAGLPLVFALGAAAAQPSFDCSKTEAGTIEADICASEDLSKLDRKMAEVYRAALAKAGATEKELKAMQRGWIKGRNECWKADGRTACIRDAYQRRIADLQAHYRLVAFTGPVFYTCDGNPSNEVAITHFDTEPKTLIAERGDRSSLMFPESGAQGAQYVGGNERLRLVEGKAYVVWGYEAPEMVCQPASTGG